MNYVLVVTLSYIVTNLLGYLTHRWLHVTGTDARASHDHHHSVYPVHDFWDEHYREPPAEKEQIIFYAVPGVVVLVASFLFLPWPLAVVAIITMTATGKWNQYVHDSLHIKGHWLERFSWFWRWRNIHVAHHYRPYKTNLGIISFWPDRVFGTYVEPSELDFRIHMTVTSKYYAQPEYVDPHVLEERFLEAIRKPKENR